MNIIRFLAEVNRRTRNAIPLEYDPMDIILARVGLNPDTLESHALRKATLAAIATTGEMSESDLWALSHDALVLLDTFADCLYRNRYRREELETFATKLLRAL